jgi:hypothetical protein
MPSTTPDWTPQRFRAPAGNGAVLIEPAPLAAIDHAGTTRNRLDASQVRIQGRSLGALRAWARQTCLAAASEYTSQLAGREIAVPDDAQLLFVGGHQPALFHPGVWTKNFLIGALAARTNGAAVNLIVDNDTLNSTAINVPAGSLTEPRLEWLSWDAPQPVVPWEDARLLDAGTFREFGRRSVEAMRRWNIDPLISGMWPDAVRACETGWSLIDSLVVARHRQERRWGLGNLELPVSRLCAQPPFLWFASHLLAQLPRFRAIYNDVLWEYRRINRVRSRAHPVPELEEREGWIEAPFWVWTAAERRRRHVFARQLDKELLLSDGADVFARLKLDPAMDACCAVEGLQQIAADGIRFRTRALTTTLFARLCLGDLFVHGIGGAKYDEMNDRIIERFYGIAPPPFLTATSTLHLPIGGVPEVSAESLRRLRRDLRDLQFNAERHGSPDTPHLAEKRRLVAEQNAAATAGLPRRERRSRRAANRERYVQLRNVEAALAQGVRPLRAELSDELARLERRAAASAILRNREFAYCLYPADVLQALVQRLQRHVGLEAGCRPQAAAQ